MPFYAYAISEDSNLSWRYIIVFSSHEVADQWWRAIQTAAANNVAGWSTVSRITPQFYTHKPSTKNIRESIVDKNVASQLSNQIFFQLLNDRDGRLVDIIPTQANKDLISGKHFYIRSQRDPTLYWHVNSNGAVLLSRDDAPTPFIVGLHVPLEFAKPAVLIGSDDIVITVSSFSGNGKNVSVDNKNALVLSERRDVFKFDDFVDSIERVNSGQPNLYRLLKNDLNRGEAWELV